MSATLLIVEDHDTVRTSLREWLMAIFKDWHVLEAKSGEEAVALAADRSPDLVLMDIGLPQMNGIEATRRIKAALPQTQVVILTIQEASQYRDDAARAGASGYVVKRRMHTELIPLLKKLSSHLSGTNPDSHRSERDRGYVQ